MLDETLISGHFCKREDFEPKVVPTDEEIGWYVEGKRGRIRSEALEFLRECEEDPDGKRWNAEHADCIFCSPDWLFEILFVYFPTADSWEQNYQQLRALVGPEPLDYTNVHIAVADKYRRECEAIGYEPPHSKRFLELVSNNPYWKGNK